MPIYDSNDPNYPDLPHEIFQTNPSDEYSSVEDDQDKQEPLQHTQSRKRRRKRNRKYSHNLSSTDARKRVLWEPGIDVKTTEVLINNSLGSAITIVDYNEKRYRVEKIDIDGDDDNGDNNENLTRLSTFLKSRPKWSKTRWINVNGLNWETIVLISTQFSLHRLTIEDLIDIPTRTKLDHYPNMLFGVIPLMKLVKSEIDETSSDNNTEKLEKLIKEKQKERKKQEHVEETPIQIKSRLFKNVNDKLSKLYEMRRLNDRFKTNKYKLDLNDQLPLSYRNLFVGIEQCSFFVLPQGLIITFFESSGDDVEDAILSRISNEETVLRTSCDSSILLQNILDSIVDIIYPILLAYRKRLKEFEVDVLLNPKLKHTKTLHLMIGELTNLRRAILPITSLINSLKESSNLSSDEITTNGTPNKKLHNQTLISQVSDVYFADIVDHTLMFTDEIESMISNIDNLVSLSFNIISTDTNSYMKQLSLVTVVFLPLSFWTGYYGMNFEKFSDLSENVSYYWKIAIPFSVGMILILTYTSILHFISKLHRRIKRTQFFKKHINRTDSKSKRNTQEEEEERKEERKESNFTEKNIKNIV